MPGEGHFHRTDQSENLDISHKPNQALCTNSIKFTNHESVVESKAVTAEKSLHVEETNFVADDVLQLF